MFSFSTYTMYPPTDIPTHSTTVTYLLTDKVGVQRRRSRPAVDVHLVEVPPGLAPLLALVTVDRCLRSLRDHPSGRQVQEQLSTSLTRNSVTAAVPTKIVSGWNSVQERLLTMTTDVLYRHTNTQFSSKAKTINYCYQIIQLQQC